MGDRAGALGGERKDRNLHRGDEVWGGSRIGADARGSEEDQFADGAVAFVVRSGRGGIMVIRGGVRRNRVFVGGGARFGMIVGVQAGEKNGGQEREKRGEGCGSAMEAAAAHWGSMRGGGGGVKGRCK